MSARMETTTTTTTMTSYDWSSSVRLLTPTEDELREVGAIGRVLACKSVLWARESIERLPIRLNLESVGALTVLMALIMPRALTYVLIYPLFRLVFGTLYPAYASYKAVRTKNVKEYVKWMMYWIVFALFTCAETFTDVFFSFWFPFYYEIKIILVLWLLSPATKGSSILYRRFVHPALCRREAEIDDALARATEQGYTAVLQLGTKGVNYATTVLMQTAIKNLPTGMSSGTLGVSQSDSAISSLANHRASPSRSETDGMTNPRQRPQRRTKSEDDVGTVAAQVVEIVGRNSPIDSEGDVEYLDVDFIPSSAGETTTDSVDVSADFKKPQPAAKKQQPAAKGGGGLVQQLRKSYSLSDLTGEKEDENRNTERSPDEVDMDEPRRRETRGRRGYSPRRTQSSSNRVDMYFSEVDVEVRQSRSREPVGSLTNIKSSDDISSGYSSGEALQSQRSSTTGGEHLVRTASVGARNRTKPRTATKKSPEGDEGQEEEFIEQQSLTINPLSLLSPHQALELFSFLAEHKDYLKMMHHQQNLSDSDDDSSTLKADPPSVTIEEIKKSESLGSVIDVKLEEEKLKEEPQDKKIVIDVSKINNEMCSPKLNELKELLESANKTVATIVSSQENLHQFDNLLSDNTISIIQKTSNTLEINTSPNISRSNSDWDCSERAGKYNKKPAPKAPETAKDEKEERDEKDEEEKALKATLVIKTGTVKSFTGHEAVDAVVKRRKKTNTKTAARESFSKLLTIPKNIFHNAFHKDKDEDAKSLSSEKSRSRSESYENVKREVDVTNVLFSAASDEKKNSNEGDTYISLRSDSIDCDITTPQTSNSQEVINIATPQKTQKEETIV